MAAWIGIDYETLQPAPWGSRRFFHDGHFFHKDGHARFVAVKCSDPREKLSNAFPLCLNSGRYRDQWHTMGRTGLVARLFCHRVEPRLDMHPVDSVLFGLRHDMLVRIESPYGNYIARLFVTTDQRHGDVFLPLHWNDVYAARSVSGRLYPSHTDPISGQPDFKRVPVRVHPYVVNWHGLLVANKRLLLPKKIFWWVRYVIKQAHIVTLGVNQWEIILSILDTISKYYGPYNFYKINQIRNTTFYGWTTKNGILVAVFFLTEKQLDVSWSPLARRVSRMLGSLPDWTALQTEQL